MSDMWAEAQSLASAHAFAGAAQRPAHGFTASATEPRSGFTAWLTDSMAPLPPEQPAAVHDAEVLRAQAYAAGLAEGQRGAAQQIAAERAAVARMIETLECLEPEPPAALAEVLAMTVKRLVAQVVGDTVVDEAMLRARALAAAALIVDEPGPARLHLAPEDVVRLEDARIDLEVVADPSLPQGAIRIETGSGWIEDGRAVRLSRLAAALDRIGA